MPAILIFSLFFAGCANSSKTEKRAGPKAYFDKALYYKERGNYPKAFENLKKLKQRFLYSSYNKKALLLTADIYFAQKKFALAVQSYKKRLSLYPEDQKSYVLYQIGMSYKSQLPDRSDHDLSPAEPALKAFERVLKLKADSPFKQKARAAKREILNKMADRELKTALFFKTQGWNRAGFGRVQYFIKKYPESPLMPKALLTGFQLARRFGKNPEKLKDRLIKGYPDSKEAKTILRAGGGFKLFDWAKRL